MLSALRTLPNRGVKRLRSRSQHTLAELVNIAEQNNPDTRVAWENAKARAADLGIAKSTLYPTLAAAAIASSLQAEIFFGNSFQRQTEETYSPVFILD
jgi:outer membrane protein